ncbi:DNA polymerase [bacterium]|nr:DNA polymerase [bacterium]
MAAKSKKKTLVLLDAHAILHRAYHALPDFSSPKGEPTGALYGVVAMLLKTIEELKPDYITACFDLPQPTYRHEVFEDYKAGRKETDESLKQQINRSRDIFEAFGIRIFEHAGFEADDILGTIVEQTKDNKDLNVIIASGDMDTLQLVSGTKVKVYTLRKGIKDTIMYDEKTVKERFLFGPKLVTDYKGLRGDPSDNIPGIAGIGEKTATTLITKFGNLETIYKKLKKDEQKFLDEGVKQRVINLLKDGEDDAVFSKMLATIRRDVPITFTLPEKTWKEKLDVEVVLTLFNELGFRTLGQRVQTLFGTEIESEVVGEGVDALEFRKAAIALWLLESDTTNPSLEDILGFTREHGGETFEDAKKILAEELKKQELEPLYQDVELPLIEVLESMKKNGVKVDIPYLKKLSKKLHKELDSIETKIHTLAGSEFNINSPKQLGEVLYDTLGLKPKNQKKTSTGQRSTRESELQKLKDEHAIIPLILRNRELQKLVSTYIDTIPEMVEKDGRLRTTFVETGTTTGRFASKDPNLQNIPTRTEEGKAVRGGFIAETGYKLVSMDYSQIELRIAASLSGDKKLIEIFKNGEDVHHGVARQVFGVGEDEVTSEMRRRAKIINFGILYGMGVNALRQNLGDDTPREEAQQFLNAYFNTFTRLAEYLEETKEYAREHGYTKTLLGRRRHFAGIQSHVPFIRASAERMAINAPVQGTAADVMRMSMNDVYAYIKKNKWEKDVRILLQVHDEMVFEINEKKLAEIAPKLKQVMESVLDNHDIHGIPILVDVEVGDNWAELEEYTN